MNSRGMVWRPGEQVPAEKGEDARRRPDFLFWLGCLLLSAFLIVWITLASGGFGWRAAILLAFLPWMLLRAGGIVTTLLRVPAFFALDFTVGVTVISVAVMAWKICVPLSVWLLLIVLVIAIVGIPEAIQHRQAERVCSLDFLAVIVALVAATGWCQDLIRPLGPSQDTFVVFKPWSDFFFHATILGRNLPNQTLLQVGNFEWKGLPAIFYHYASYSLPLLLAKAGNVPSYAAVVGFWAPFGSFLAGLSAYTLGRVFWGQGAGLAALAAAALFPDLYLLGEAHPFYGYYWLQHIEPAGLYGVSIAGTAVVFTVLGVREGRRSWILAGIVVGVMVAFFKVQIFAASFPVIFSMLLLGWPPRRRWQWLWLGLCVTVAVTGVQVANHFHIGPEVHFDLSGGSWYWKFLAGMARDTPAEAWYRAFQASDPFPQHLPQAIGLLLLNSLGLFALIAPLLWLIMLLCWKLDLSDGISLAAILILLLMTFGLGRNSMLGLPEELIHRPFVWAYWLVASLTAGRLYSLVATRQSWARLSLAILCLLTLAPIYFGRGLQMGKWPAAASHYNVPVDHGLVESAHFIRNQEPTDAVVQDSRLEEWYPILDGLSERGSFAARSKFWANVSKAFRESNYRERLRQLHDLDTATDIQSLKRGVRKTGIRWYVVRPGDSFPWPASFWSRPVFESHGYKVYDMKRSLDLQG